jgi:cytochrome c-type biogenesis protein CcmF
MEVLELGKHLLVAATVLTCLIFALSLGGLLLKERRLVVASRVGFYALLALVGGSAGCLVYGFVNGTYDCEYVFNYSEKLLPTGFKIAGLWAGLDGSLLFWTLLVTAYSAAVALQHHWSSRHPMGRRLEPYVYLVLSAIAFFFVLITWHQDPFKGFDLEARMRNSELRRIPLDASGSLLDGAGLNPQLVNYWFVIHPPNLYLGLVGFTVPFAFAMAALISGHLGDYWIRIVRRWTMVTWLFLTNGIILGGLWAYRQLGWGGYWAWDPVENASFLPWLTGTAFLHSVMIQERRDMLKGWNLFLILLTFFMTIVATWMTRSGVVQSIHAFAGGDIGEWFQYFLFTIAGVSLFAFFFRYRQLLGTDSIESLLSREAAFYLNNLVLVVIAVAVFFLSFFGKISHDWFAENVTELGIFNVVITPFFALLLFLTAVGPGLGWVKTTGTSLRRNFAGPIIATIIFTGLFYALLHAKGLLGTPAEVLIPRLKNQHPSAFYPTGLFAALAFFICSTVALEFYRGWKSRIRFRGDDIFSAFFNLVFRQNRRYGGYTVHVGIAILTAGIIGSSMFQVKKERVTLRIGESLQVGPYTVAPVEERRTEERPGEPYEKDEVLFRVTRAPRGAVAHGQSETSVGTAEVLRGAPSADGEIVAELWTERRFYPKNVDQPWISEVSIERRLLEDIYIYFSFREPDGRVVVDVYVNPLMMLIYLGWFTMIAGGILAALPISGSRVGLSE